MKNLQIFTYLITFVCQISISLFIKFIIGNIALTWRVQQHHVVVFHLVILHSLHNWKLDNSMCQIMYTNGAQMGKNDLKVSIILINLVQLLNNNVNISNYGSFFDFHWVDYSSQYVVHFIIKPISLQALLDLITCAMVMITL